MNKYYNHFPSLNLFFSHTTFLNCSLIFLHISQQMPYHISLLARIHWSSVSLQNRAGFQMMSTKQGITKCKNGLGIPVTAKESHEQENKSKTTPLSWVGVPQTSQVNHPKNICWGPCKDPCRLHDCHYSLCVPYDSCSLDSVGHVSLMIWAGQVD